GDRRSAGHGRRQPAAHRRGREPGGGRPRRRLGHDERPRSGDLPPADPGRDGDEHRAVRRSAEPDRDTPAPCRPYATRVRDGPVVGADGVKAARVSFVLFFTLVLQTTLLADLTVFAVRADVVLLFAIAGGVVGGPDRG